MVNEDQFEDLEDLDLALQVFRRIAEGREGLIPLEELERAVGVDDSGCGDLRR